MYPKQQEGAHGPDPSAPIGYVAQPQHVIMQQPQMQPVLMPGEGGGLLAGAGGAGGFLAKLANKVNPSPFANTGIGGRAMAALAGGGGDEALPPMMPLPPRPGVPPGLELLADLEEVTIKQKAEFLEVMSGFETANRYNVLNPVTGQRVYFAGETTEAAALCCGGPRRPFSITIVDFSGRPVLLLDRPCDALLYTSAFCPCFGSLGGRVSVRLADGSPLGEIVHSFACYQLQYQVLDAARGNQPVMTVSGPLCGDCCMCSWCTCGTANFPVHTVAAGEGEPPVQLGNIKKRFSGFRELMTDADTFGVNFPRDLDVRWKALMFAAVFLIDFMYFEQSSSGAKGAATGVA